MLLFYVLLLFQTSCVEDPSLPIEEEERKEDTNISTQEDKFAQDAVIEVNKIRQKGIRCGNQNRSAVPKLQWNKQLAAAAQRHAEDMSRKGFFAHQGSDGTKVGARVTATGYQWRAVGENIADGYTSTQAVMAAWKDSPSHCKNMMNKEYTEMGLARVDDIWVQVFAKRK